MTRMCLNLSKPVSVLAYSCNPSHREEALVHTAREGREIWWRVSVCTRKGWEASDILTEPLKVLKVRKQIQWWATQEKEQLQQRHKAVTESVDPRHLACGNFSPVLSSQPSCSFSSMPEWHLGTTEINQASESRGPEVSSKFSMLTGITSSIFTYWTSVFSVHKTGTIFIISLWLFSC